jgi:hypothetical protein
MGPAGSTSGYVKLLLPPRQSRGNSNYGLDEGQPFAACSEWTGKKRQGSDSTVRVPVFWACIREGYNRLPD